MNETTMTLGAPIDATKTQALLFDLGGVVFDIDFDRVFERWAAISELGFDEIKRAFHFDDAYRRHECGVITVDDYFAHVSKLLKLQPDHARISAGWNAMFLDEIDDTLELIESARQRFPCYALTNTNAAHEEKWAALFPRVVRSFDRIFMSHEMGRRKPDRDAFIHVANAIGVPPGTIMFFDDTLENVEGAKRAGLAAIHVCGPDDVRRALVALGCDT